MDPNRDNPFIRFSAFWLGLGIVLSFALLLAAIAFFNREKPDDLEQLAAKKRYETKAAVEAAQAEDLAAEDVHAAIPGVAKALANSKPVAVEKPDQVIPGSPTAIRLEQGPAADFAAVDNIVVEGPIDPAVMELGKNSYLVCAACHGQEGQGVPNLAPPLAGSEWVKGPVSNLIRIQLRGLNGPIKVAGVEYNLPIGMAPLSFQNDEQIAAVLTYIRNSFGNEASAVLPKQVEMLRSEVGKSPLTVEDLIQP